MLRRRRGAAAAQPADGDRVYVLATSTPDSVCEHSPSDTPSASSPSFGGSAGDGWRARAGQLDATEPLPPAPLPPAEAGRPPPCKRWYDKEFPPDREDAHRTSARGSAAEMIKLLHAIDSPAKASEYVWARTTLQGLSERFGAWRIITEGEAAWVAAGQSLPAGLAATPE